MRSSPLILLLSFLCIATGDSILSRTFLSHSFGTIFKPFFSRISRFFAHFFGVRGQSTQAIFGGLGKISWFVAEKNIAVTVELQRIVGWIGIGWHSVNDSLDGMKGADFAIGSFDSQDILTVNDYVSAPIDSGHNVVKDTDLGGTDDILSFSGGHWNGKTIFTFEKNLITKDIYDNPIQNGEQNVICAFGDNFPSQHTLNDKEQIKVNFILGTSEQVSTVMLPYIHGSLMIISYALCMSFGIFVARYLKSYPWWFPLHIITQVLGVLLAISGFAVALIMSSEHFGTIHSWFGLSVLSLSIIAPSLGWAADLVYDPSRISPPWWPDQLHWWIGRLTVMVAYVTIILGMRLLEISIVLQLAFASLPLIYASIFLFIEAYRRIYSSEKSQSGKLLENQDHE